MGGSGGDVGGWVVGKTGEGLPGAGGGHVVVAEGPATARVPDCPPASTGT
jgi:hypothetical protein